jgi:hypothetical protein
VTDAAAIWTVGIVNFATLATVIIRDLFALARDRRRRQYELEDRQQVALKLDVHDQWEREERRQSEVHQIALANAVKENTELTNKAAVAADAAYQIGNHMNEKLVTLGIKVADVEREQEDR